jgi:hypothetical protein
MAALSSLKRMRGRRFCIYNFQNDIKIVIRGITTLIENEYSG